MLRSEYKCKKQHYWMVALVFAAFNEVLIVARFKHTKKIGKLITKIYKIYTGIFLN